MFILWIVLLVGLFFFFRHSSVGRGWGWGNPVAENSPLETLQRRYARGEINQAEFLEKKKDLER